MKAKSNAWRKLKKAALGMQRIERNRQWRGINGQPASMAAAAKMAIEKAGEA
jgi:hypothetical protein